MQKLLLILFVCSAGALFAQPAKVDTTVYETPEVTPYPLLNSCRAELHPGWTVDSMRRCGETQLLRILAQNIRYPEAAREANTQGTVVARFIVEPTGRMSYIRIIKDIGNGCGEEALRVIKALDTLGLRWQPAQIAGKPVRSYSVLPLRFKLTEATPYIITESGDSLYTIIDTAPQFKGGDDELTKFVINRVEYPKTYLDSCKAGVIELSLLIHPDAKIEVENQLDFSNLGMDFQFKAIQLANRTANLWEPATYQGKKVLSSVPLRVLFKSSAPGCTSVNEQFDQAMVLAAEGVVLSEQSKTEEAIQKWNAALTLTPDNCELLYYRGTALLNINRREDACTDYNRIKQVLGTTWFESVRKIVCGF